MGLGNEKGGRDVTCGFMNHMNLQREILFGNPMLARRVEMELLQGKLRASKLCRAIHRHLNGRAQVGEFCCFHARNVDFRR